MGSFECGLKVPGYEICRMKIYFENGMIADDFKTFTDAHLTKWHFQSLKMKRVHVDKSLIAFNLPSLRPEVTTRSVCNCFDWPSCPLKALTRKIWLNADRSQKAPIVQWLVIKVHPLTPSREEVSPFASLLCGNFLFYISKGSKLWTINQWRVAVMSIVIKNFQLLVNHFAWTFTLVKL